MKNSKAILTVILLATITLSACSYAGMKMVCSPGHRSIGCPHFSRGEGDEAFEAGSGKKLATVKPVQSRGSECVITILSKTDQGVNIFLDSVWQGSLDSKATGYLTVEDGKFQYLHAISTDGEYVWQGEGDCNKDLEFRLSK